MSQTPQPCQEVVEWLLHLRLPQYVPCFQQGGYETLKHCKELTDERLLELQVLPTGHRRRVLRSLEALGIILEGDEQDDGEGGKQNGRRWRKPPVLVDKKRMTSFQHRQPTDKEYDLEGSQTLPPGAHLAEEMESVPDSGRPRLARNNQQNIPESICEHASIPASLSSCSSSSSSESFSITETPSDWEVSPEDASPSNPDPLPRPAEDPDHDGGLSGGMVENSIYETQPSSKVAAGAKRTRSYRLRHRPVPEIPDQTVTALQASAPPPAQATGAEQLTGSEGLSGANGTQKALQRSSMPIAPYGEMFLHNDPESTPHQGAKEGLRKGMKDKLRPKHRRKKPQQKEPKEDAPPPPPPPPQTVPDLDKEEYSTVEDCASILSRVGSDQSFAAIPEGHASGPKDGPLNMVECELYSAEANAWGGQTQNVLPHISPYACFYGTPKDRLVRVGWLDKLSPQGNCVFQRRWVRLDGECLFYYNNDKEMYSKGMILVSAIQQVRGLGDNKFEVVTPLRTFTFRAEREGERQEWMEALQAAVRPPACSSQTRSDVLPRHPSTNKRGLLELRGHKGRVLASLAGSKVRLCKTEQDYKAGLAIAEVELTAANIKDVDRRSFDINTPFKSFCFTAESQREKEEWIEAVQESITETLSDYEVAEKIWSNEANRSCADCRAPQPEWASVNLGVVICKRCAGQHRSLSLNISKIRSLKMDSSIWSNALVELFLEVGNKNANSFWAANLPMEEEIFSGASAEQRATFIRRKYRERKYRGVLEGFDDLERLNQALCASVVLADVLQTMMLVFSGADVMCATGDPTVSTPYLLAQRAGQRLQMEFLHQNKLSDFPRLEPWSENSSLSDASLFMDGFLYISSGPVKTPPDRRGRDEITRRWCTLEGGFLSYYESERSPLAIGRFDVTEVVSLSVSNTETMTGAGAVFTVELYLQTERVLIIGAETQETRHDWIQALTKCFIPARVEGPSQRDMELIGRLHYKEGHDLHHWRVGWFAMEGSTLRFSRGDEEGEEAVLQLKQLQELTVSTHTEGEDKIQVLLMVEGGRTVYIHGFNKVDFALWHSAITLAAATDGNALGDQQLTKNGVPIIVDSCISFVTQYGLCQDGVYQSAGDPDRVALLLEEFARDARNVKLREKEHQLEDVTDTLKSFFSRAEDALLTKELYPYWVAALDERDERQRIKKYSMFIESLPRINSSTLEALLQHLYRIDQCSHLNHMPSESLASVFSSCMFQTRGQMPQEASVIRDLISNYVTLFNINEDRLQQMERENIFITRWNDKKDAIFSPAGDLIFEVYLEKREPENCCLIKISPTMRSAELAETALNMRNVAINADDLWTTFEVIENGELERPLHHGEKVLEQVLDWRSLDSPSSAFLVIKKFSEAERAADEKAAQKQSIKAEYLKFNDGSSKLLSGHKFQDKYVVLHAEKLLLYRDIKGTKAEKTLQLSSVKCYLGLKKKLKPPNSWGFTVHTDKQQWHFCCERREAQASWVASIIGTKFGSDLRLRSAAGESSRGRAATEGFNVITHIELKRGISLTDGNPRPSNASALHRLVNCQKLIDILKVSDTQRSASADARQPRRRPSPSPSRKSHLAPSPAPPQSDGKGPTQGGEAAMPSNLLSELNLVLSKTGRTAKTSD
ncbi:arf-GAP with Rho-GAP domain, ANK repeat and PH domain-containing protein 2 [Brachionichthys hirsutus]|uniref:arf-GAP with Rho-GAP domain, ANK repeat and PH domain-containing protein 2 n=1 Tax=Brachionichthys hirsutus TaxID=412623 RepID=UPI003604ADC6